jgi:hypothetical protein
VGERGVAGRGGIANPFGWAFYPANAMRGRIQPTCFDFKECGGQLQGTNAAREKLTECGSLGYLQLLICFSSSDSFRCTVS